MTASDAPMRLGITNFRSIAKQEVELAPITVLYGANGAGKSSLLYSLLSLKNFVVNPNQSTSAFFSYVFTNLGGFDAVVFDHRRTDRVELEFEIAHSGVKVRYGISFSETEGTFKLAFTGSNYHVQMSLPVAFPYPLNGQIQAKVELDEKEYSIIWNGVTVQVRPQEANEATMAVAEEIATAANSAVEMLRTLVMVPLKRGFTKPQFAVTPPSQLITEDEVASLLVNDKYLAQKVSHYLEKTVSRSFQVNVQVGTGVFSLDATDRITGVGAELVNEGFGVNQLVYTFAQCLHQDSRITCIEEPEIHLHPSAVKSTARTLVQISREEKKNFIVTTHSEAFLFSLLSLVERGDLAPSQLACYFVEKDMKQTQFSQQAVNDKGQIEGGLTSFIRSELEDIDSFLSASGSTNP